MRKTHALAITGGTIVTMDADCPQVEAVLCLGGRIVWTGKKIDLPRLPGVRIRKIDLGGRLMLPAFCDGHTHFLFTALESTRINLDSARSLSEALALIRAGLKILPDMEWVLGAGFDKNLWPKEDRLRKEDLDAVVPNRPAAFFSKDEHTLWANSLALQQAGITRETPDPEGGGIDRDPQTGEPTGRLAENAYRLIWDLVPQPPQPLSERLVQATFARAHEAGVTQIHDVGSERSFEVFQSLYLKGKLRLRVLHAMPVECLDQLAASRFRSGLGDEFLRLGAIKVFLDGALGSQSAYLKRAYASNPKNLGVPVYAAEEFSRIVRRAFTAGWAVAVHALGDAAVRRAVDAFLAHRRLRPHAVRSRIEHVQLIDPRDLPDLARAGVVASMQPSHLLADREMALEHWGRRARWAFAFRSLRRAGVPLVFGSDTPIERIDPLEGIFAAVNRARQGDARGPWSPAERLTVEEAVAGFTIGAACASSEAHLKGSITPGKVADFVVLSDNIFGIPKTELSNTRVEMTVLNGEVVYKRK